jgi:hypothetical protein
LLFSTTSPSPRELQFFMGLKAFASSAMSQVTFILESGLQVWQDTNHLVFLLLLIVYVTMSALITAIAYNYYD